MLVFSSVTLLQNIWSCNSMKTIWYLLNFQNPFTYVLLSAIKGYWDDTSTKEKVAQTQSEGGGFLPL